MKSVIAIKRDTTVKTNKLASIYSAFPITLAMLLVLSIIVGGCGKSGGKSTVSFNALEMISSSLTTTNYPGGLMIFGYNIDDRNKNFSLRVTTASVEHEIDNGRWDFMVLAWMDSTPFSGNMKCGSANGFTLDGTAIDVQLQLSEANCDSGSNIKPLKLTTCNVGGGLDSATTEAMCESERGSARSFKIGIAEAWPVLHQTTLANANNLMSACLNNQQTTSGGTDTISEINPSYYLFGTYIPVDNILDHYVPILIKSYSNDDCTGSEEYHFFPFGIPGQSHSINPTASKNNAFYPDGGNSGDLLHLYLQSGVHDAVLDGAADSGGTTFLETSIINSSDEGEFTIKDNGIDRPLHSYIQIVGVSSGTEGEATVLTTASGVMTNVKIAAGDEILWAVMAGSSDDACGAKIGSYGWGRVASTDIAANKITLEYQTPILVDYTSVSSGTTTNQALATTSHTADSIFCRIQVIRMPHLNELVVKNHISISPPVYDMSSGTGGILPLHVDFRIKIEEGASLTLDVKGKGFKGGTFTTSNSNETQQGDGYNGAAPTGTGDTSSQSSGGGAARDSTTTNCSGGGGAGYLQGDGGTSATVTVEGGFNDPYCKPLYRCMRPGGGGGGGYGDGANGGRGGGIVLFGAEVLEGDITIDVRGDSGGASSTTGSNETAGGGGGGGMALAIIDKADDNVISTPSIQINKNGGDGASVNGIDPNGGGDGYGMISTFSEISGTGQNLNITNFNFDPTATTSGSNYRLDNQLASVSDYTRDQLEVYYSMMNRGRISIPTAAADFPIDIAFVMSTSSTSTNGSDTDLGVIRITSHTIDASNSYNNQVTFAWVRKGGASSDDQSAGTVSKNATTTGNTYGRFDANDNDANYTTYNDFEYLDDGSISFPYGAIRIHEPQP
jgi:hypothetical protein